MENKKELIIMIILIMAVIILSSFSYRSIVTGDSVMGDEIRKQNSVDFCESLGWAYTNRYNADTKTIWCGSKYNGGFDWMIYNVEESFFGNLKLKLADTLKS